MTFLLNNSWVNPGIDDNNIIKGVVLCSIKTIFV